MWWQELILRFKTRSLVVIILSAGSVGLAIYDPSFRPSFSNIVSTGLGGYLAQLVPQIIPQQKNPKNES